MKTIVIKEETHTKLKVYCAMHKLKIKDAVESLVDKLVLEAK